MSNSADLFSSIAVRLQAAVAAPLPVVFQNSIVGDCGDWARRLARGAGGLSSADRDIRRSV
jgi:hypothetical protein